MKNQTTETATLENMRLPDIIKISSIKFYKTQVIFSHSLSDKVGPHCMAHTLWPIVYGPYSDSEHKRYVFQQFQ